MKQLLIDNFTTILAYIIGAGGVIDSWRQRKKRQADALDGMQKAYDMYVSDSNQRFLDMQTQIKELTESQKELKKSHHKEIESLKTFWKGKYERLKNEFESYKKRHP